MYKHLGKSITIAAFISGLCSISHAETLNDVYQQALKNDHQYKAAQAALDAGKESVNLGRSGLLPQVGGEYSWNDIDNDLSGIRNGAPIEDPNTTFEQTKSGYTITLSQPLFNLSLWHEYQGGKLDSKVAVAEFEAEKQSLIIRTAEAYFNVLRAIDNFETAKAEQNANGHQLEQTQKRFEVGLTAITDVHEAQAAYDNSLARRLLSEGNVGINFEALEVITGQSYQGLSPLKKDFPISPPSPADRKAWESFAIENNFTLAAASLKAKSAKQAAKKARAGHYPTLSANASYSDNNTEEGVYSDYDTSGHSVGLKLTVPIFTGGATSSGRRKAQALYTQSQEGYNRTQRDVIQNARSLHLTVQTDVATVKARQQAITSSRSALEATQAGYEVGTRDLVDVLVAQRTLYTAERDYSDSLYTYVLNTLRLKEVAGTLSSQDILDLEQWLDRANEVARDVN